VKWRFYDAGEDGFSVSVFPQFFLNNPNDAVRRGITPVRQSFLLPFEFSKKLGPVDGDYEIGYQAAHKGPNGWLTGLVVGHEFTSKLEGDIEFYNQGTFHPAENQPTIDFGARCKIQPDYLPAHGRTQPGTHAQQSSLFRRLLRHSDSAVAEILQVTLTLANARCTARISMPRDGETDHHEGHEVSRRDSDFAGSW